MSDEISFTCKNSKVRQARQGNTLTICSPGEVRQIELDLVPTLVQAHRHGADERLYSGGRLQQIIRCSSRHILLNIRALEHHGRHDDSGLPVLVLSK